MVAREINLIKSANTINQIQFDRMLIKESCTLPTLIGTDYNYVHKIVWKNAIGFLIIHLLALWGFCKFITGRVYFNTMIWTFILYFTSSQGVLMGAHRLFTHKSYSATPLLRAILLIFQTIAGQNSMYVWCRDHRLHHRYSETDADPHNSKRGFFFSHIGWLMSKKHPYVIKFGKMIDMSDLEQDWMVMFQKKYYFLLYIIFGLFIPIGVPIYYFGESFVDSLFVFFFRYVFILNGTWLVNSAAHLYGTRPYDKPLLPMSAENSDYRYLTPGHFLIGAPLTSFPDLDYTDVNINRLKFWKVVENLRQDFWKLWSKDYLTQLQNRPKWQHVQPNLKEGDLVIVRTNNCAPLEWPMARIIKVLDLMVRNIQPVESWFVSLITMGEGWHNYHHTFPWDYKTAELSMHFNITATLIRMCEKLGLAYNLKTASQETVTKRIFRTGDGTHYAFGNDEARAAVAAISPVHPLNPSYTVKTKPPKATL